MIIYVNTCTVNFWWIIAYRVMICANPVRILTPFLFLFQKRSRNMCELVGKHDATSRFSIQYFLHDILLYTGK